MAEQDIHEPQLPGVKTFARDSAHDTHETESSLGVTFTEKSKRVMTTPETTSFKEPSGSILTNRDDVFNVSNAFSDTHVETGTIVTDKRQSHRSIGGTLTAAFNEWWGETATKLQGIELVKKQVRPTVQSAETRKEVIAEAAQYTRQVPRDDHTIVVEKLKTLSRDAEHITGKPYVVKKPIQKTNSELQLGYTAQSATTRTAPRAEEHEKTPTLDLRKMAIAPAVQSRAVPQNVRTYREDALHTSQTNTHTPPPHHTEAVVRPATLPDMPHHTEAPPHHEPTWTFNTSLDTQTKVPAVAPTISVPHAPQQVIPQERAPEPVLTVSSRPVEIPEALRPKIHTAPPHIDAPAPEPQISSLELHTTQKSNARKIIPALMFASVVIVGAIGGIYAGIYVSKNTDTTVLPPTDGLVTPPAYFTPDRTMPLTATPQKDVLMRTLTDSVQNAQSGVTQFYIVEGEASKTNGNILTTAQFFEILQPRVDTRFIRALEDTLMIGGVDTGTRAPFLVLKSNAFDTAFAGMLEWETFMQEDLAPFFGTPAASPGLFTDALAQNRSIRILRDESGNEVLIYAFVSRDTIIITNSTAALSAIVGRI